MKLSFFNQTKLIETRENEEEVYLALLDHLYEEGDKFIVELPYEKTFLWVQMDETLEPSLIFVKEKYWQFEPVLKANEVLAYSPKAFIGTTHYVHCWVATSTDIHNYRNLARNVHDEKSESGAYPHALANVETRDEGVFYARNAIDGVIANEGHGAFPFQSWRINQRQDATLTIDFGREVETDKIALVLRGDYPHDSYWTQVTVTFSDGTSLELSTTNSLNRQYFTYPTIKTSQITLGSLVKHEDEALFPALTQIEVYGAEIN